MARIVKAILNDENHLFPVSSLMTGEHGLHNICISLPAIVGRTGIKKILDIKLSDDESKKLKKSAKTIREALDDAGVR